MTALVTYALTRTLVTGSPAALMIESAPGDATYLLMPGMRRRPAVTWRKTAMPDPADVHGTEFVSAVRENSEIPLNVLVQAASEAALDVALDALDEALAQFAFQVTQTTDGVAKTWDASPAPWSPTDATVGAVLAHYQAVVITIPVYPIPGV